MCNQNGTYAKVSWTKIFYMWVQGFANDFLCGVWCSGFNTCLPYVRKSSFKQQFICKFGIAENVFSLFFILFIIIIIITAIIFVVIILVLSFSIDIILALTRFTVSWLCNLYNGKPYQGKMFYIWMHCNIQYREVIHKLAISCLSLDSNNRIYPGACPH